VDKATVQEQPFDSACRLCMSAEATSTVDRSVRTSPSCVNRACTIGPPRAKMSHRF